MDQSEVLKFERAAVGTITLLSEAIRVGAGMRPQSRGCPFANGGSCAWGAAAEALGHRYDPSLQTAIAINYVASRLNLPHKLVHNEKFGPGCDTIWGKNDTGGFTREQIADWLETQGL